MSVAVPILCLSIPAFPTVDQGKAGRNLFKVLTSGKVMGMLQKWCNRSCNKNSHVAHRRTNGFRPPMDAVGILVSTNYE